MMVAIQWFVFLAVLAAPSQPKEVLYSDSDYNTNDAFVTREGEEESSLDTEELSSYAGTTAQDRSCRQTISKLRQEMQYMQVENKRKMRQLRQRFLKKIKDRHQKGYECRVPPQPDESHVLNNGQCPDDCRVPAHSGIPGVAKCRDGTHCRTGYPSSCCVGHGGVVACPPSHSYLCVKPCTGGQNPCCHISVKACGDNYGGVTLMCRRHRGTMYNWTGWMNVQEEQDDSFQMTRPNVEVQLNRKDNCFDDTMPSDQQSMLIKFKSSL